MTEKEKQTADVFNEFNQRVASLPMPLYDSWNAGEFMSPVPNAEGRNIFICPACRSHRRMAECFDFGGVKPANQYKGCKLCKDTGLIEIIPAELMVCTKQKRKEK